MDAAFLNLLFRGKLFIATLKGNLALSILEGTNTVKQNNKSTFTHAIVRSAIEEASQLKTTTTTTTTYWPVLGGKDITSERLSPLNNQIMKGEELMLKLKLQYFGHLIPKAASLEKTLMLGKIEGKRKRG